VTFTTIGILVLNLVVDLMYAFIDPRVRMGEPARARARRSHGARGSRVPEPAPAPTTG
jgi:hypothetical protein